MRFNLFLWIKRLPKAFRTSLLWQAAEQAATDKDYAKAFTLLESIYQIWQTEMPSERALYSLNILCSNVASKTGHFEIAVSAGRIALEQIRTADGLSKHERDYLSYYCKVGLMYCAYMMNDLAIRAEGKAIRITFDSLRKDRVRDRFLQQFPIAQPTIE